MMRERGEKERERERERRERETRGESLFVRQFSLQDPSTTNFNVVLYSARSIPSLHEVHKDFLMFPALL